MNFTYNGKRLVILNFLKGLWMLRTKATYNNGFDEKHANDINYKYC